MRASLALKHDHLRSGVRVALLTQAPWLGLGVGLVAARRGAGLPRVPRFGDSDDGPERIHERIRSPPVLLAP